jgi:hypothetical protein
VRRRQGRHDLCGTGSSVLAEVDDPFAVDLHKGGTLADADGVAMDAAPFAALTGLNRQGNTAFDPTTKYAFGFEVVKATRSAHNINLDAADLTDYADMVTKGYTTLLVRTATWKGNNNGSDTNSGCTSTTVTPAYDFTALPKTVKFRFGLIAPTVYRNAQNPALTGAANPNEEHPRGVQTAMNQSTIAQLTFHIDHVFWESFVHDSPAHFDSFASRYGRRDGADRDAGGLQELRVQAVRRPPEPPGAVPILRRCRHLHCSGDRRDGVRHAHDPGEPDRRPGDGDPRLLRLHDLQPQHVWPPQRRRPIVRRPPVPVASMIRLLVELYQRSPAAVDDQLERLSRTGILHRLHLQMLAHGRFFLERWPRARGRPRACGGPSDRG